ncbi:MAG: polysaccharide biosynthesis/export family protein [Bacteroidetes bacterium]|nr:polysaccharide biosynthesis/export family protein [Bacteroidota bacterium]
MRSSLLLFFAGVLVLSSCVPNRKFVYLQKNDLGKKDLAKDTATRKYNIQQFDYKVQTNDILSVRYQSLTTKEFDVLGQQSQQTTGSLIGGALLAGDVVDEQGQIPVPVVGKVTVAGLTIFQIQDTLQRLANIYLESPNVKVRLLNYRATFLGEVNKEGSVTFNNNRVTLPEAIGLVGGLNELADRANIKIIRQVGSKAEVHYVNLLDEDIIRSPYYYVHQNDIVVVPALKVRPYRTYFGQNLSLILSSVSLLLLIITLNRK